MYDAGCLALRLPGDVGIAVTVVRLGVTDIPRFGALQGTSVDRMADPSLRSRGQPEGTFSDVGEGLFFSFGKMTALADPGSWSSTRLRVRLGYGISFKTFRQILFDFTGTGSGLDAGMLLSLRGEACWSMTSPL